jgi:hypothetical protein
MNEKILNPGQILTGALFGRPIRVVMENEQEEGRQVYEVYKENLGYDITSLDLSSGELRLIEVKGISADSETSINIRDCRLGASRSFRQPGYDPSSFEPPAERGETPLQRNGAECAVGETW